MPLCFENAPGTPLKTRFGQLSASGTKNLGVACPYCWAMLSDAQRELGHEQAKTWDVIELVAMAMGEPRA
jgi:hypothetical protein